jgi:hypothetical protein
MSAQLIASICCWPPESEPANRWSLLVENGESRVRFIKINRNIFS